MFSRKLPLWYQLAQILRAGILGGQFPPASRVAPEVRLARQYRVSVVTVRQALKSLEEEGLISRQRGRGTFVNPECPPRKELKLMGTVETVIAQQFSEETIVLEQSLISVPPHLAPLFGAEREVSFFRRLRQEQGAPLSYALNYVVPQYGHQIPVGALRRYPMLKILRDVIGVKLKEVQISVEAQVVPPEVAKPLEVDLLSPILFFSGIVYDQRQRVVDLDCIYYRADRFKFTLDLEVSR
ncbi:MAG: GntR family transcriptional regulator [Candidatus Methylomirabilales bacterium]